ncbi:MAG: phosphate propanoyltransferase [Candidatus Poribacteria bacterium]
MDRLVEQISRQVLEQLNNEQPNEDQACHGCAMRSCSTAGRACDQARFDKKVPIGVSARHVHVTQSDLEILYGDRHRLTVLAPLYQPGAFAAKETVTIVGHRMRAIEGVRILGGVRSYSQVEVAPTDAIRLGLHPPIRDSGDLKGAEPITLVGPHGSVRLDEGAIIATRHAHMTPEEAEGFGVSESDRLKVRIVGERSLVFENIRPKIHPDYVLQMHLDTDDANAAGLRGGEAVELLEDL